MNTNLNDIIRDFNELFDPKEAVINQKKNDYWKIIKNVIYQKRDKAIEEVIFNNSQVDFKKLLVEIERFKKIERELKEQFYESVTVQFKEKEDEES